jgi:hypothetical protein
MLPENERWTGAATMSAALSAWFSGTMPFAVHHQRHLLSKPGPGCLQKGFVELVALRIRTWIATAFTCESAVKGMCGELPLPDVEKVTASPVAVGLALVRSQLGP